MIEAFLIAKLGARAGKIVAGVLPWIGIALAIWAAWALAVGHGKSVQKAKDQITIDALTKQRDGYKANADTLQAALTHQNAAVEAAKADGDKRMADGKKALSEARRANAGLSATAEALRASARRKVDGTACPVSETLQKAGAI